MIGFGEEPAPQVIIKKVPAGTLTEKSPWEVGGVPTIVWVLGALALFVVLQKDKKD